MIQFIEKQGSIFCNAINNEPYLLYKASLYKRNHFLPLPAKVKGSTLGWYIRRRFVSYNQLTAAIKQKSPAIKPGDAIGK
jgi:hypothetical protein